MSKSANFLLSPKLSQPNFHPPSDILSCSEILIILYLKEKG